MLNVPAGAAVWGTFPTGPETERTPPVRRPARRAARLLGAEAVAISMQVVGSKRQVGIN